LNEPASSAYPKLRSEPRRRISRANAASPTLTDPAHTRVSVSRSPILNKELRERQPAQKTYGIELQDYSEQSGLRCRASLALDEPLSWQSSATSLERGG
jgi:hypothetical protein